jgi:S1-C subfamily serine protease
MDTAASSGFRFSNSSQGFAIPIGDALDIAAQIEAGSSGGTVHVGPTAMLGVGVAPDNGSGDGAQIAQVLSGGPAAAAGLAAGDTITSLDGQRIRSASDLSNTVLQLRPGISVNVTYVDASGAHSTSVHLATGPAQ